MNTMTDAQRTKLQTLCERYRVTFTESDYLVFSQDSSMMPGWAEGWVGGLTQAGRTLYVGVSPEGDSHS